MPSPKTPTRRDDYHAPASLRNLVMLARRRLAIIEKNPAAVLFAELCLGWGGCFPALAAKYINNEIKANVID